MQKLTEYQNVSIDDFILDKDDLINLYHLQMELLEEECIIASLEECINIWQNYSSSLSASWLFFPQNKKDIVKLIKNNDYFTSFEDYCKIEQ